MTDNEFKYWTFLNYSQQDNCANRADTQNVSNRCWGDWLYAALKDFSIPAEFVGQINGRGETIPERIDSIFNYAPDRPDEVTLSANIRQELEQSRCLIVICSPRSAKSDQMNEVVRYFKQLGRGKYILPIVIAGEPNASNGIKLGGSPENECLVPALRHPVGPDGTIDTTRRAGRYVFVDARHGIDKREVLANDQLTAIADLEMAKIQLIALLLGIGFNGLWWREQKKHFLDLAEARLQTREALNQVEEVERQLQEAQRQTHAAQTKALEMQHLPREIHGQIQDAQNQAQAAQDETREVQKQLQEFQNQARFTQSQLAEARQLLQNRPTNGRNAHPPARVLTLLTVLALLTAGIATSIALWQRQVAGQTLAKVATEEVWSPDLAQGGLNLEKIRRLLQNIGGATQDENRRHSLDCLAAGIPRAEIPEALKAASVIVDNLQRTRFQKQLLLRLGWVNPVSALTNASAIEGKIFNDAGLCDSATYFQLAVLDNWMQTDLTGACRWVGQLPYGDARHRALAKIINWIQSQPTSDSKNKILESCIGELVGMQLAEVSALAESLGDWRATVIILLGIAPF